MSPLCFSCIPGLNETLSFLNLRGGIHRIDSIFAGSSNLICTSRPQLDIVASSGRHLRRAVSHVTSSKDRVLQYKNHSRFSTSGRVTENNLADFSFSIFCASDDDSQALPLNTSSEPDTDNWASDYATLRLRIEGLRREEAKQALRLAITDADLQSEDEMIDGLSTVYVLLVHAGTDQEGFCCLKFGDQDFVLSFEGEEEAVRYAVMLEAQNFPMPLVEAVDTEDIRSFCKTGGHMMGVVPAGSLFIPPEAIGDEATSEHCTNQTALGPRVHSMEDMRQILNNLLEGGR
mmetsp:Transcript_9598/g.16564  ORF Transcript_9598/g.16564 Transcript_9598/m.16564 type:complete len:289 (+) Transcript_9598:126-992(+)